MTATHNSKFSLANSYKKVRKSVLSIIMSEQVEPIRELRQVTLLARTLQGNTKKASLDKLPTLWCLWQCRILNSEDLVTWATPSWTLPALWYLAYRTEPHLVFIFLPMPLNLSLLGAVFPPWFSLPNSWNFSKLKTATRCRADPRSVFWLGCILSKRCLLFLPLLRLFCLLESGIPRGSEGGWEQKQTRYP